MKQLIITVALSPFLFFSCQNASQSKEAMDSVQTTTDTATTPKPNSEAANTIKSKHETDTQTDGSLADFDETFQGTINGNIKVKLNISQINRELRARAVYLSSKKIIDMEAVYPSIRNFELTEKVNGNPTGIWKISENETDEYVGTWTSPNGSKQMPIRLAKTSDDFDSFLPAEEIKSGYYVYKEINEDEETKEEFPVTYSEELHVKNMSGNSIAFDLYIQGPPPGVHLGTLNAIAYKSGKSYRYKNDEGCEINMAFEGDSVKLDQKGTDVDCGFGANIGAFGTLKKSKL